MIFFGIHIILGLDSKKSPTGPTEWTPKKPEYLINLLRGPLVKSHSNFGWINGFHEVALNPLGFSSPAFFYLVGG